MGKHVDTNRKADGQDPFYASLGNKPAHLLARYESWRFDEADGTPVYHYYREPAWDEPGAFAEALELSWSMISTSDGWLPNRAAFIYREARREYWAREEQATCNYVADAVERAQRA